MERILSLAHPEPSQKSMADKRTWRAGRLASQAEDGEEVKEGIHEKWTTMDVLTAYALKNGWVTAKAGRPDVNRAGNACELV